VFYVLGEAKLCARVKLSYGYRMLLLVRSWLGCYFSHLGQNEAFWDQ